MAAKNPQQMAFLRDLSDLLNYAYAYAMLKKMRVVMGEVWRPDFTQKHYFDTGKSKVEDRGSHGWRCAVDLVFIKDNMIVQDPLVYEPCGDYWKSMSRRNRWGGDFKTIVDPGHFERKLV